jgi:hypothetical protein
MFKRKMSKKEIDIIIKSNPEHVRLRIPSKHSKVGFFDITIPKGIVESSDITVTIKIPKKDLVNETKTGKIGSYRLKQRSSWWNLKLPTYFTIHLYVDDEKK